MSTPQRRLNYSEYIQQLFILSIVSGLSFLSILAAIYVLSSAARSSSSLESSADKIKYSLARFSLCILFPYSHMGSRINRKPFLELQGLTFLLATPALSDEPTFLFSSALLFTLASLTSLATDEYLQSHRIRRM